MMQCTLDALSIVLCHPLQGVGASSEGKTFNQLVGGISGIGRAAGLVVRVKGAKLEEDEVDPMNDVEVVPDAGLLDLIRQEA